MGGLLLRLRTWWETADRTQKAVTIFGGIFLAILLLGTFYFASKPKLELAFTGLTMAELGAVTEEIKKQGIPVDYDQNGNVRLPGDKIAQVKASLALGGKLPASVGPGVGDLKDMSAWMTPSVERERLKAILEGQITESIKYIQGVQSARVQITPGTDSPFSVEKKPATASVSIIEKSGNQLGGEQAKAIAQLVAYSTPGLDVSHVAIVNQAGTLMWDGESQGSHGVGAEKKLTAEINEGKRRERELQSMLDNAYGVGTTIAKVDVTLDFDRKSSVTSAPVTAENPTEVSSTSEAMTGQPTNNGPGAPASGNTTSKDSKGYVGEQKQQRFDTGETQTSIEQSAGTLTGMAITVLADDQKIKDKAPLEEIVSGYLVSPVRAEDAQRFKSTVSLVTFDKTSQAEAKKAVAAAGMSGKIQQVLSILPIVALLLVGFIVVKAISKAAKDQNVLVQALPDGRMIPMRASLGAGMSSEIVAAEEYEEDDADGAPVVKKKKRKPEIGEIPDKVDIPLEQVKKMTNERPEAVAMLIKSWLLEDKR